MHCSRNSTRTYVSGNSTRTYVSGNSTRKSFNSSRDLHRDDVRRGFRKRSRISEHFVGDL